MKRILYIALFLVGIVAVSCTKQEIIPVSDDLKNAPVWVICEDTKPSNGSNGKSANNGNDIIDDGTDDGTGITDPNEDTDGDTPIGNQKP